MSKEYDIVVYGVTGFTGKLVFEYLVNHKETENLNLAIAGRNSEKLKKIHEDNQNVDYLVVDANDFDSVDNMCLKSNLVISTVGPYNLYGEEVVKSCVKHSTHYVDLTGEPNFVHKIRKQYSQSAIDNKSLIVNCCGFESIIPDVGTYYTVNKMKSKRKYINYFIQANGQISGGTWASFLNSISSSRPIISKQSTKSKKVKKIFFHKKFKKWAMIFPVIDKHIVKRTSKEYAVYGEDFDFNEYMLFGSFLNILTMIFGLTIVSNLAKISFIRSWLLSLKPSGSGPSKEAQKKHWFNVKIEGQGEQDSVLSVLKGGDPGYGDTSKFISEIALCITHQYKDLNKQYGIVTPVECTKDLLIERLMNAGIKFD